MSSIPFVVVPNVGQTTPSQDANNGFRRRIPRALPVDPASAGAQLQQPAAQVSQAPAPYRLPRAQPATGGPVSVDAPRADPPRMDVIFPEGDPIDYREQMNASAGGPVAAVPGRRLPPQPPQLYSGGPSTKLPRAQDYQHGQQPGDSRWKDAAKAGLKGLLTLNPGYALGRFAGVAVNPQAYHDEQYHQALARVLPQYNIERKAIDDYNQTQKEQYDLQIKGVNAGETMARTDESYAKAEDARAAAADRRAYQGQQVANMQADNQRADRAAAEARALQHIKYAQATGTQVRPDAVKGTSWENFAGQVPSREIRYELKDDSAGQLHRIDVNPGGADEIVPGFQGKTPRVKVLGDEEPDAVHNRAVGQMKEWEHKRNVVVPQEEARLQRINAGVASLERGSDNAYGLDSDLLQAMAEIAHMRGDLTKPEVREQVRQERLQLLYAKRNEQLARVEAARQDRDAAGQQMVEQYSKYPGFVEYGEGTDPAKTKYMKLHPERLDPNYRPPRTPRRGQGFVSPLHGQSPFIQ